MAYVSKSTCGGSNIGNPDINGGNIAITGAPLNPSVLFPISDQKFITSYCNTPASTTVQYPGGCNNFIRNDNMFHFLSTSQSLFTPQQSQALIQQIGMCQSDKLQDYLAWKQTNGTKPDQTLVSTIVGVCNNGNA